MRAALTKGRMAADALAPAFESGSAREIARTLRADCGEIRTLKHGRSLFEVRTSPIGKIEICRFFEGEAAEAQLAVVQSLSAGLQEARTLDGLQARTVTEAVCYARHTHMVIRVLWRFGNQLHVFGTLGGVPADMVFAMDGFGGGWLVGSLGEGRSKLLDAAGWLAWAQELADQAESRGDWLKTALDFRMALGCCEQAQRFGDSPEAVRLSHLIEERSVAASPQPS